MVGSSLVLLLPGSLSSSFFVPLLGAVSPPPPSPSSRDSSSPTRLPSFFGPSSAPLLLLSPSFTVILCVERNKEANRGISGEGAPKHQEVALPTKPQKTPPLPPMIILCWEECAWRVRNKEASKNKWGRGTNSARMLPTFPKINLCGE